MRRGWPGWGKSQVRAVGGTEGLPGMGVSYWERGGEDQLRGRDGDKGKGGPDPSSSSGPATKQEQAPGPPLHCHFLLIRVLASGWKG